MGENKSEEGPSLKKFLGVELTRNYVLEYDEEQYSAVRQKVYLFMKIPREVEKFMVYGFFQCADSFLFVCTFLPMRVFLALFGLLSRIFFFLFGYRSKNYWLEQAEICDLLKTSIIVVCANVLSYIDTSIMYHIIKSQSVIKLYIFFNMLEVGDKLFSAFGQDIIDALFWTATEPPKSRKKDFIGLILHLLSAVIYVFLHSLLVLAQATILNVAINSSNRALLIIMLSNNFVEIKGSVFKKFDKNNLFQVSCSDVRERFHLLVLLSIVILLTMKEYSWKEETFFGMLMDCSLVVLAEMTVDWIKHAFITKFNELPIDVYKDYTYSLAYDIAQTRQKHAFTDHSDLVARRMGFIPLPLGVVLIHVLRLVITVDDVPSCILLGVGYACLVMLRILNNVYILGRACDLIHRHQKERVEFAIPPLKRTLSSVDTATTPTHPAAATGGNLKRHVSIVAMETPHSKSEACTDLRSPAIFANSNVNIHDISLNEEVLRADGEEQKPVKVEGEEGMEMTRSDPNICVDPDVDDVNASIKTLSIQDYDDDEEDSLANKRAESEPVISRSNNSPLMQPRASKN